MTDEVLAEDPPVTEVQETSKDDSAAHVERSARAGGWKSKDEWEAEGRDPKDWTDAPTFVVKAAEILPNVRKDLDESKAALRNLKRTLAKFQAHHEKTETRAYERAMADLIAKQADAAAQGDADKVTQITEDIVKLNGEIAGRPQADEDDDEDDGAQEAVEAWRTKNRWFETDRAMTAFARSLVFPKSMSPADQLLEVEREVRKEFPHKFENPRRNGAALVESGGGPGRPSGKTYADLPPDAKKICDEFVRDIPGFTREKYLKDYFA